MRRCAARLIAALALAACDNGGAGRTVEITARGVVAGEVYFDANGSRTRDAADHPFAGAGIRILRIGGVDTVFSATTGVDGRFLVAAVPVGSYAVLVDSASAGDTARVVAPATVFVTLLPDDSAEVSSAISFPLRSVAEARVLAVDERLFVRGIALHARDAFSDTTLHIVDATGTLRATRVRPSGTTVVAGDSVVLRGRIGTRLGQPVIDDVSVFVVGPTLIPTAPTITTAQAATAGVAGILDAALVRLVDAEIIDTATVAGNHTMTMDDGSGLVTVILDRVADLGFRAPLPAGLYVPTNRFDVVGVLVPTGTGTWRLKPRTSLDLTLR